jgi:two-component system, NarL family, sensor histidine kinase UhpB
MDFSLGRAMSLKEDETLAQNHAMVLKSWIVALFWLMASAWACAQTGAVQRFEQAQISWQASASPPEQYEPDATPLPSNWGSIRPEHAGQAWYRIRFDTAPAEFSAVLIERACTHAHIWLNGSLLSQSGSLQEPISRNCYYPHWAALPAQLLKPQGNVLDIQLAGYPFAHVAARQRHAGLSQVLLGSQEQLRSEYDYQYFWNITVAQIIGVSITVFGMALLMLFAVRRQDSYFLYFGLTLVGWAFLSVRLYWQEIPLPGWATEILITSLFPPVVACAIQFLLHYVSRPQSWVARALLIQVIAVPLVMWVMGENWVFRLGSAVFTLLAVEFLIALLYAGWQAWRHMRTDFWVLGSALALASLMVVAEIAIQNAWLPLPRVHLIHFGQRGWCSNLP